MEVKIEHLVWDTASSISICILQVIAIKHRASFAKESPSVDVCHSNKVWGTDNRDIDHKVVVRRIEFCAFYTLHMRAGLLFFLRLRWRQVWEFPEIVRMLAVEEPVLETYGTSWKNQVMDSWRFRGVPADRGNVPINKFRKCQLPF